MNNKYDRESENEIRWTAYLNGEQDLSDAGELQETEEKDLTAVWEATGTCFSYAAADPDKGWIKLQNKIQKPVEKIRFNLFRSRAFQYAASVLIVIGLGYATWQVVKTPQRVTDIPVQWVMTKTSSNPSAITRVVLPDGSVVRLNANTTIEYPERFVKETRHIKLSGEAFFEVAKDSVHPFRIETAKASVEVLGTSFNVSAYPNSERVEVNVETGKVRLTPVLEGKPNMKSAILPAGQRGWVKVLDGESGQEAVLAPNYSSWLTRVITFQRTPLNEVCAVLENTYHIKLRIENSELGQIPYTANFANLNPDYIVEVIARTHHLRVKKSGDEIILAKSGN